MKLLGENLGANLLELLIGCNFLCKTPKPQATKGKIDELDYSKLNKFCIKGH